MLNMVFIFAPFIMDFHDKKLLMNCFVLFMSLIMVVEIAFFIDELSGYFWQHIISYLV